MPLSLDHYYKKTLSSSYNCQRSASPLTSTAHSRFHIHGCTHPNSTHYRGIPTMFTPVSSIPAGVRIFSSPNPRESRRIPRVCPHYRTHAIYTKLMTDKNYKYSKAKQRTQHPNRTWQCLFHNDLISIKMMWQDTRLNTRLTD